MGYEFKDKSDRTWTLAVTVAAARRVQDETGLSIYGLPQKKFQGLFDLVSDPFKLVDVAWVLCRESHPDLHPSALAKLTPEGREAAHARIRAEFEEALDGPAVERMADAVMEAIPDFFSDGPGRANLRDLMARAKRAAQRLVERDRQRIQSFDPETVNLDKLEKEIVQQRQSPSPGSLSAPSGDGPVPSASTPDGTPSPS